VRVAGRCLGVDLGRARIGLALSDPLGLIAQPLAVLPSGRRRIEDVASAIDEHEVTIVVVGLPRLLSGAEGQAATDARAFAERLAALRPDVRVELWDERLTTRQAERAMIEADVRREVRRARIDAVAAALILQGWLDAQASRP
jgi:putative Holliday junction resolvase